MNEEMSVMPFTIDAGNPMKERLFRQVSFPGSEGVYRLRVVQAEGDSASIVTQKRVDTGLEADSVEGAIFRVKAVLDSPIDSVSESYWLTLGLNPQPGEVKRLNQYRIRGVSDVGYRSDWIYSELKDDQNELLVYEMLYDLLDILTMVREGEVESLVSLIVDDALQSTLRKDRTRHDFLMNHEDEMTTGTSEQFIVRASSMESVHEQMEAALQEVFQLIGKELGHEFKESFMSSHKEFSELMRLHRVSDQIKNRTDDIVTFVLEVFLEDAIDKIIKKSRIEVFLENGENQAIYLGDSTDFDIKREVLKSAHDLMPSDDFVLKANGTVQLILEPALQEQMDYVHLESTKTELNYFKNEILEALIAEPEEELLMLMKLFITDALFPYLALDQLAASLYLEVEDEADLSKKKSHGIVRYDIYHDDDVMQYMIVKDLVKELISGDLLPHIDDYFVHLVDKLIGRIQEKAHVLVDYEIVEAFDNFAGIGERLQQGYMAIKATYSEDWVVEMLEGLEAHYEPQISFKDNVDMNLHESFKWIETARHKANETTNIALDERLNVTRGHSANLIDQAQLSISSTYQIIADYQKRLSEYYDVLIQDDIQIRKDLAGSTNEAISFDSNDSVYPVYMPNISDQRKRLASDNVMPFIHPQPADFFKISGKEKVQYALGNGFDEGWPIGEFILGVNTLKGVDS
ncbi:hypothetical protein TCA2_4527 [Paenibacillus sp. TCA20]|uniref:hypothetical protein n=1 Tax=Paenibacillus sp. TCA20 TaxID=1499968 RepID=UPI0004DAF163|nr:hypothetical protein [Paenibacillus sp. TCA20]GAK42035.1 hypothetical protein TCA2_4527 [Paenibacillus sp. TCA20]